jgi:hypothetical protein
MNAARTLANPLGRHLAGMVGEDGGVLKVALTQTDALAVFEINGGNE